MKIVVAYPPNIDQVDAVFKCREQNVIYAYGDTIYNPHKIYIPNHLLGHEAVHIARQGADIEGWWGKYLVDEEFRYREELAAHKLEFAILSEQLRDRNARAKLLMATAARLSAPLYQYKRAINACLKDLQS